MTQAIPKQVTFAVSIPLLSLWENSTNSRRYSLRKIKVSPRFDKRGLFHLCEGQRLSVDFDGVLGRRKVDDGLGDDCMLNTVML